MRMEMTARGKDALVRILPSCGGTMATMWHFARVIRDSESMNLREILGDQLDHPDNAAFVELITSCEESGTIDLEGVLAYFASYEHLSKFDTVQTAVGAELAPKLRQVAHTLLPLTLVDGEYVYDNGAASLIFRGLIQTSPTKGTPYCHLASLIWFEDGGISAGILDRQLHDGVAERAASISEIDYAKAPILSRSTREAIELLGL